MYFHKPFRYLQRFWNIPADIDWLGSSHNIWFPSMLEISILYNTALLYSWCVSEWAMLNGHRISLPIFKHMHYPLRYLLPHFNKKLSVLHIKMFSIWKDILKLIWMGNLSNQPKTFTKMVFYSLLPLSEKLIVIIENEPYLNIDWIRGTSSVWVYPEHFSSLTNTSKCISKSLLPFLKFVMFLFWF